jgi:uncharacterized protein
MHGYHGTIKEKSKRGTLATRIMPTRPAIITNSLVRIMQSTHTGRVYEIRISLPYAHGQPEDRWPFNESPSTWPTVYLLDANCYFGMVTEIVRSMSWCGSTTDAIVVGIAYPEDPDPRQAWWDFFARRDTDLTPVPDEQADRETSDTTMHPTVAGDASNFRDFIKHELIPLVEKEYQGEPSRRVLAGHSLGGLFAAYALFDEPELFDTYVINSPSLWDVDRFLFRQEEMYAKDHKTLKARAYLSMGEYEEDVNNTMLSDMLRFVAVLESRSYEELALTKQIFMGLNHCEVIAPGFQAGLKMALKKQ